MIKKLPQRITEGDYRSIVGAKGVDQAIHLSPFQDISQPQSIYEQCVQQCFLPSIEQIQRMLEEMSLYGISSIGAPVFHEADLKRMQALAEGTIAALWCFVCTNNEKAWASWLELLNNHKIDLSYALLMGILIGSYRRTGGERGIHEGIWFSRCLELFYLFDTATQQWKEIEHIAYPLADVSFLDWCEHVCPSGSGARCACPWGYLCQRCYCYRSVSGKDILLVQARGGQCPVCWAYERISLGLSIANILDMKKERANE